MPNPIRFVLDSQRNDPDGWEMLQNHKTLCQLPEHTDQVQHRKVGWNGAAPIWEFTCPACGIRWRRE